MQYKFASANGCIREQAVHPGVDADTALPRRYGYFGGAQLVGDVGKFGKVKGDMHPSQARRLDPVPARPVSKASGQKVVKRFGMTIESRHWKTREWQRRIWSWHETAKQRDQAMATWRKSHTGWWVDHYRDPQPIERGQVTVSGTQDNS